MNRYSPLFSRCVLLLMLGGVWFATSPRARAGEAEAYAAFLPELQKLCETDPKAAIEAGRRFLQNTPDLHPYRGIELYGTLSEIQINQLKDKAGALATYDQAIAKYPTSFYRNIPLIRKARLLLELGRGDEAEAVYKDWDKMIEEGPSMGGDLTNNYVALLRQRGKSDKVVAVMTQYLTSNLSEIGRDPAFTATMVDSLISEGKFDEALGWAKLYLMVCNYRENDINLASQTLMRAWMAKQRDSKKVEKIDATQADATQRNPLQEVKLPEFDPDNVQAQTEKAILGDRIVLLIIAGEIGDAMAQAQGQILDEPDAPEGLLEAARVFKAGDLNLVRANVFLEYFQSGEGENPMAAFMKEHPMATQDE